MGFVSLWSIGVESCFGPFFAVRRETTCQPVLGRRAWLACSIGFVVLLGRVCVITGGEGLLRGLN